MISKKAFKKILKKGFTIAFAESMTGGALSYELIKNAGASKVVKGSIVAYSVEQKINLLHLDPLLIYSLGVVSKDVAVEMARSIKKIMNADIGIGITGNAGPTVQDDSSRLEAYISIIIYNEEHVMRIDLSDLTRVQAIKKAVLNTYQFLEKLL